MANNEDIIPGKDFDFNEFQSDLIADSTTNAVAWGIPAGVLTAIGLFKAKWDSAWLLAKDADNRTHAQIVDKDVRRGEYEPELRKYIKQYIRFNTAITDTERTAMHIPLLDTVRTDSPRPDTKPLLEVKPQTGSSVKIFFTQENDEAGSSKRKKPDGVDRMEVAYIISATPITDVTKCNQFASSKKSPLLLTFNGDDAGKRVYMFTRWVSKRNEPGDWSSAYTFIIPG